MTIIKILKAELVKILPTKSKLNIELKKNIMNKKINIAHLNIQSITNNTRIEKKIFSQQIEIICLIETYLTPSRK